MDDRNGQRAVSPLSNVASASMKNFKNTSTSSIGLVIGIVFGVLGMVALVSFLMFIVFRLQPHTQTSPSPSTAEAGAAENKGFSETVMTKNKNTPLKT